MDRNKFTTLDKDPTKTMENKVQRTLRNIKSKISAQEYKKSYLTDFCLRKFNDTAKLHKMVTSTYQANCLQHQHSYLPSSKIYFETTFKTTCTTERIKNLTKTTRDFIGEVKTEQVPNGDKMVSFDVKSLLTIVPLDQTTNITLRGVYENNELSTLITKNRI